MHPAELDFKYLSLEQEVHTGEGVHELQFIIVSEHNLHEKLDDVVTG